MARRDGTRVFAGCSLVKAPEAGAHVTAKGSNRSLAFDALFYPVESVRSGMHDPEGMLWISLPDRKHALCQRPVLLTEIAPTLLYLAGVETDHPFARPVMPEVDEAGAGRLSQGAPDVSKRALKVEEGALL
jgi:hypothetical protein